MQWYKWLKRLRVAVSLCFFLVFTFLFIDFTNLLSSSLVNGVLYFQFVPALLKFVNLLSLAATGFILVILLSLLFGRVYCSFLCPLGTLQDILHFFSGKFRKKKVRRYKQPMDRVRYPVMAITFLLVFFTGEILLVNLLDPYANFGKVISNLVRPIYFQLNNLLAFTLERMEIYTVKPVEMKSTAWLSLGYAVVVLGVVGWMSWKHGRLYCNTICPVGTLLGRFAAVALFRIRLDEAACNSCGICSNNCKANCIDSRNKLVDFSRCVGCLDCLYVCPNLGVDFHNHWKRPVPKIPVTIPVSERRNFVKQAVFIPAGLTAVSKRVFSQELNKPKEGMIPINRENPVTPPGSVSQRHFNDYCIACTLCVSACPTQVLQPSLLEYGISGMMQPRMDYLTSFCNFECTICTEVCPTGAILPLDTETKKLTQVGKSIFVKENCVVYTDETACGACSEHCPTKAVQMIPYDKKPSITIPEVTDDICIGCGACEYACPTDPKSIYVEGNVQHVLARKPAEQELDQEQQELEEFPF